MGSSRFTIDDFLWVLLGSFTYIFLNNSVFSLAYYPRHLKHDLCLC